MMTPKKIMQMGGPMSQRPQRPERPIPPNRMEPERKVPLDAMRPQPQGPPCTKTCAPGSTLNIKRCICETRAMGRKGDVFDPQTGRFNTPIPEPSYGPPQGSFNSGGSVIKGSSLRRQASTKGLRTSKKHK